MGVTAILTVALATEADIVLARQRARAIAEMLGFDAQDRTRIATAVSELARNAVSHGGGGRIAFAIDDGESPALSMRIADDGPGIADPDAILEGRFTSAGGMGLGIVGARRLMHRFTMESRPGGGTIVTIARRLPAGAAPSAARLAEIGAQLAHDGTPDLVAELRAQNRELLRSLAALEAKREESERLDAELESTNRGVVALYGELDAKAAELQRLNAQLEMRVAEAVGECQQANDALRQSQKMEAVGQLTGGIAHDFNNLLQIVTGNLEILMRTLPDDPPRLRRAAGNAMQGAERAATLTQRLLAFSRRQPLDPRPINLDRLVEGLSDLMHRTLGEAIVIETRLADGLWPVEADANQLENALLNLAVNARDAMPRGGTLTIATANRTVAAGERIGDVAPGDYATLAIADTGEGMSDAVMARVLEPFFTTKGVGRGTGLGLSMVYGFVTQSGGHLHLESTPGEGTTVTLYLPRFSGVVDRVRQAAEDVVEPARPGETILLVEDDEGVRSYSREVLAELGYAVLSAQDGAGAVAIIDGPARIDLLFTDVVLPGGMTGRDVADRLAAARPGTPVLFTSGYARETIADDQRLDAGIALVPKPFGYATLATRIHAMLHPGGE